MLNDKHVNIDRLCREINEIGIPVKIANNKDFVNILNNLLKDEQKKQYLEGIINDLDKDKKLVYDSKIKIESEFTKSFLELHGFSWPYIDKRYLLNYFKYLEDIGYFNIKIK